MREVSVRMLQFCVDLARIAEVDDRGLKLRLSSLTLADATGAEWVDWDDFAALLERLELAVGGPDAMDRLVRDGMKTSFPELRAFATVFVRPLPLFDFVMTRFMSTMYRHITIDRIEQLDDQRVRWEQTIPASHRPCLTFHRMTESMVRGFPCHLDLPEATLEQAYVTGRSAEFVFAFPPPAPLTVRGARAVASAASVLAVQLEEAFAKIALGLRAAPLADGDAARHAAPASPATTLTAASQANGVEHESWAERFELSRRQREVFRHLVEGCSNKEIASRLQCTERNVEFHVSGILRAARVASRAELLVKVLRAG